MKDTSRQPTSLARLEEIISYKDTDEPISDDQYNDTMAWLQWAHNFLSARKLYHKKTALRSAILQKMAKTLLSKDELAAIDVEAERQLGNLPDEQPEPTPINAIVGVCKEDNPRDVDEAYGAGTYARLFPSSEEDE